MGYQAETTPSVSFGEAISLFFRNYGNFSSRSRRSEYWKAYLFLLLVQLAIALLSGLIPLLSGIIGIVSFVWSLAIIIPTLSLQVRRLHDVGRSGWWYFLPALSWAIFMLCLILVLEGDAPEAAFATVLLPIIASIVLLVWMCTDSTEDNKWGSNPKHPSQKHIPAHNEIFVDDLPDNLSNPPPIPFPISSAPVTPISNDTIPPTGRMPVCKPVVLTVRSGALKGAIYLCEIGKTVVIGRSSNCDVCLSKYQSVSGRHCCISAYNNYVTLTDLGSTNGTLVGHKKLAPNTPVKLQDGALFSLGNADCTIQIRFQ